mgnify:CR=1 FL=1
MNILEKQFDEQSYSGVDIIAIAKISNVQTNKTKYFNLGNIQTISISTHRDTVPVRTLGFDRPKKYKQGTKSTSGSLVFTKVNYSEWDLMIAENATLALADSRGYQAPDAVPEFDMLLFKGTEYPDMTRLKTGREHAHIKNMTLMTSGTVLSIHDVLTEQTFNYVALEFKDFNMHDYEEDTLDNITKASTYYKDKILRGTV